MVRAVVEKAGLRLYGFGGKNIEVPYARRDDHQNPIKCLPDVRPVARRNVTSRAEREFLTTDSKDDTSGRGDIYAYVDTGLVHMQVIFIESTLATFAAIFQHALDLRKHTHPLTLVEY